MNQQHQIYKKYTSQIKHNSIILLKQQRLASNQDKQNNKGSGLEVSNYLNDSLMQQESNQKQLEPLVLKKFEDYFKKNSQPIKNIKILNKIIHNNLISSQTKPTSRYFPLTSNQTFKLVSHDINFPNKDQFIQHASIQKDKRNQVHTSRGKKTIKNSLQVKQKIKNYLQKNDSQIQKQNNTTNSIISRNRKRQKLNNSIDLCRLLNLPMKQTQRFEKQFYPFKNFMEQNTLQQSNYLRIEKSFLTQRKIMSTQLSNDRNQSKQEQLKKTIRNKIIKRKKVLQDTYKDKLRSRSPSPTKQSKFINFIDFLNPLKKEQFSLPDLIQISLFNSHIDEVKLNMNGCFFTVYVQDGNGSQLIKSIVRSISGWRVAQIQSVANFVWTQGYRRNLLQKKPKQIVRDIVIQNDDQPRRKRSTSRQKDPKQKMTQSFLRSRKLNRRNSNLSNSPNRSSHKIMISPQRQKQTLSVNQNYTELSLNKAKITPQKSFERQARKIIPQNFQIDRYEIKKQKDLKKLTITPNFLIHNHMIGHKSISDKKNLLFNLRKYYFSKHVDPFLYIPQSHDIKYLSDEFLLKQNQIYLQSKDQQKIEKMKKQVWIIKPGQDSNRGRGIIISKGWQQAYKQISKRVKQKQDSIQYRQQIIENKPLNDSPQKINKSMNLTKKYQKTVILQKYIIPFLYNQRKFDIRSYMLVTYVNNVLNGYVYQQCYIRTSSKKFDIDSQNKYVHLTNDAIQCLSHQYGKYQEGNKVSQSNFEKYFNQHPSNRSKSWKNIKNEMSLRCQDILKSSSKKLVGKFGINQSNLNETIGYSFDHSLFGKNSQSIDLQERQKSINLFGVNTLNQKQLQMSFELFGLDFMIDEDFKLWLIQVNTNPAITHDCSRVLGRLIPRLLQNTFQIAVMPYMRPSRFNQGSGYCNRFSHIYQETINLQ